MFLSRYVMTGGCGRVNPFSILCRSRSSKTDRCNGFSVGAEGRSGRGLFLKSVSSRPASV